jgi:4-hydroxy-2-oxoheptanedioate aldolase
MPAPKNQLKQALQRGTVQYGCWLALSDTYSAEISARAGFDWVLVDGEHAPNDIRSITAQLQVIAATPSAAAVRVPIGEPWILKQVLDAGAQTVVVPMGESAAHAEQMVAAVRYPPRGIRGVAPALARASQFGTISDYVQTADDEICLIIQVESRAGYAALDGILAVDGVDGVFVGPADLAADMGYPGKSNEPEVRAAVLEIIARTHAAGKIAGVLTVDPEMIAACADAGAKMIAVGLDISIFGNAMRDKASSFVTPK